MPRDDGKGKYWRDPGKKGYTEHPEYYKKPEDRDRRCSSLEKKKADNFQERKNMFLGLYGNWNLLRLSNHLKSEFDSFTGHIDPHTKNNLLMGILPFLGLFHSRGIENLNEIYDSDDGKNKMIADKIVGMWSIFLDYQIKKIKLK